MFCKITHNLDHKRIRHIWSPTLTFWYIVEWRATNDAPCPNWLSRGHLPYVCEDNGHPCSFEGWAKWAAKISLKRFYLLSILWKNEPVDLEFWPSENISKHGCLCLDYYRSIWYLLLVLRMIVFVAHKSNIAKQISKFFF